MKHANLLFTISIAIVLTMYVLKVTGEITWSYWIINSPFIALVTWHTFWFGKMWFAMVRRKG